MAGHGLFSSCLSMQVRYWAGRVEKVVSSRPSSGSFRLIHRDQRSNSIALAKQPPERSGVYHPRHFDYSPNTSANFCVHYASGKAVAGQWVKIYGILCTAVKRGCRDCRYAAPTLTQYVANVSPVSYGPFRMTVPGSCMIKRLSRYQT